MGLIVSQRIAKERHGWPPSYSSNSRPFESYNAIGKGTTGFGVAGVFSDSDSRVAMITAPPFLAGIPAVTRRRLQGEKVL
jgi:hypothetical protein